MTTRRQKPEKVSIGKRFRAMLPNLVRLGAFLGVLYVVGLAIVARQVRAEANEMMMGVGAQMMQYAGAQAQDEPRTLHLNGQQLAFGSGHTDHDVDEVLDFFEARCQQRDGRFVEGVRELAAGRDDVPAFDGSLLDGTMRDTTGNGGYVACFDMGEQRESLDGLLGRLTAFADTGDLANIGGLRYVYARRTDEGGTHFLVFHTDERLNVYEMFPSRGDAPGQDIDGLPRPANVRRLMSAWEDGDPHAITMYTSTTRSAAELQRWYRGELPQSGWRLFEPSESQRDRLTQHWDERDRAIMRDARALHAEMGDRQVMLIFVDDERSGQSVVTVLTTR